MNIPFMFMLAFAPCILAQVPAFDAILDLQLGQNAASTFIKADLDQIHSAVAFRRLPQVSMCPRTQYGEFELKKVNPKAGRFALTEHVSVICPIIDSVAIDTFTYYEIPTSAGLTYFMRLVERTGSGIKVRVSPVLPADVMASNVLPFNEQQDWNTNLDFRKTPIDSARIMMLEIGSPHTAVILKRLDGPAVCPSTERWDFELKKTANSSGVPVSRKITENCGRVDSLDIDTNLVYEVHTAENETYYMRLLFWAGGLVRMRLTLSKPTMIMRLKPKPGKDIISGAHDWYRSDGKSIPVLKTAGSSESGTIPAFFH
ncbi:MAG: hypothetical protein JWP91_633 [Fibrobacteres bacterium]|nr:hypothetical protein [Fibrobacterota bacterium]